MGACNKAFIKFIPHSRTVFKLAPDQFVISHCGLQTRAEASGGKWRCLRCSLGFNFDGLLRHGSRDGRLVQASHYYLKYDSDRLIIRWTLALGLACTGGNSITWPYWIYNVAVKRFGDPSGLETIPFSFPAALVFVGFNASFVHVFYAWRMKVIGGSALSSWILPVVVCVCSMLLTMIITAHNLIKHPEVTYLPKIFTACYIWAESAISSDTLITFGMMYLLIWRTRDAGVNESAKLTFRKIVLLSVQNNVLSLILQIFLTVMLTRGPGYWYSVVDATMCPAYTGSLLFALNSRSTIRSNAFSGERTAWPTLPRSKMSGALDAQPTIHDLVEDSDGRVEQGQVHVCFDAAGSQLGQQKGLTFEQ